MEWYKGSIPDAVAEVKSREKVLLVFVVGEDELSRKMAAAYDDPAVSDKLNSKQCVALKLVVNSVPYQQFSQIYPVVVIPSSYFIGKNGMPIEIITGSLEPPEFMEKIDKIFQVNDNDGPLSGNASMSDVSQSSLSANTSMSGVNQSSEAVQNVEPMESSESEISGAVHNGEEISNQPSTSYSETASEGAGLCTKNSDSGVPLDERVNRAKSLIENRRQNKALEEQEDWVSSRKNCVSSHPMTESGRKRMKVEETENKEKREEQERRQLGKALQQAQQTRHENELKEWAQNRAKEKEEERLARERVRAQIAQDRAERAARFQQTKIEQAAVEKEKEMQRVKEEQERASKDAALRSTIARLQFRLPNGASVTHQFSADSTLGEARKFVIEEVCPPFSSFTLCTTFPRRHFAEEDYPQTLRELQLAPSAAILILPGPAVTVANRQGGFFDNLFWMLVSPLLAVWRAVTSLFRRENTAAAPETQPEPGTSGTQPSSSAKKSTKSDETAKNDQAVRKRGQQKFYQEGNVFRISNQQTDDDDDNNTWNGNSTQQM